MPTKKRKYNARFPAGRIKKIMQTDEEVGKVAQAVPIIISRTLELFVESLLTKAMQVTAARNAKTLSPSHVKQCILAESKFDFLRDLVKNIPDVSAAEEKEMMSAESSPNSSRFSDMPVPPRRIAREDSNSSSSSDVKIVPLPAATVTRDTVKRALSTETELPNKTVKTETVTSTSTDVAIDLSKKSIEEKPVVTANFYQETLLTDEVQHRSVITVNPSYASPQPSTSYKPEPLKLDPVPKPSFVEKNITVRIPTPSPRTPLTLGPRTPITPGPRTPTTVGPRLPIIPGPRIPTTAGPRTPTTAGPRTPLTPGPRTPIALGPRTPITTTPRTPVTPILNIDFTKNLSNPEIKLLDAPVNVGSVPRNSIRPLHRQNSKPAKPELKKIEIKPIVVHPVDIDSLNSGNLQIDEDYDT